MRHRCVAALLTALLIWLTVCGALSEAAEAARNAEEPADWTVLLYLCGSDLESRHGFATMVLEEIANTKWVRTLPADRQLSGGKAEGGELQSPGRVDLLIETGGCSQWHTSRSETLDLEIDAGSLQRWRFGGNSEGLTPDFSLEQTLPSASMSDPETLSDFIRWGVKTCPAKRYALVLWDHGGGGKTGLFLDELFDNDIMYLDELHTALADGGVQFETVIFDACMMANLETAWAVKDYARWMAASEEVVPGEGAAIGAWLQELYRVPGSDGRLLGRMVCDLTHKKYANLGNDQANSMLTWSLIDLSRIGKVAEAFDKLFEIACHAYESSPQSLFCLMYSINLSEEYGNGNDAMVDLGSVLHGETIAYSISPQLHTDMLDALSDAVVYCMRGPGRTGALGLSFCYATSLDSEELPGYARNCPSASYLAFLDALIEDWEAPDWVYQKVRRLSEANNSRYDIWLEKLIRNGLPVLKQKTESSNFIDIYFVLYRLNEETGQLLRLGGNECVFDSQDDRSMIWYPNQLSRWPAVEGTLCSIEPVSSSDLTYLFNIPIQIGAANWNLRCGREYTINPLLQIAIDGDIWDQGTYVIYGLWEGYDSNTELPTRNVRSLAQFAGQDYQLLYPTESAHGAKRGYEASDAQQMYRALEVKEMTLPAGTYYLEYQVLDMFQRSMTLDRVEINWDGERFSLPEGADWSGSQKLSPRRN